MPTNLVASREYTTDRARQASVALFLGLALTLLPLGARADEDPALILIYNGLGTTRGAQLWGRVVEDPGLDEPRRGQGLLSKIKRTYKLMESDEIPGARVELRVLGKRVKVTADEEGMFTARLAGPLRPGRHPIKARLLGTKRRQRSAPGLLLVWPAKPGLAVISDIDDTVLDTGVTSKATMLRRVITSNAHDLRSFSHAPPLYRALGQAGRPIVFVSGSPQNLYPRLSRFLQLQGFPAAPLFLKDFGSDALTEQIKYKLGHIEGVMALLPGYRFILVGDSGEKDPEIYREVARKHPARVAATLIHRVTAEDAAAPRFKGQRLFNYYSEAARALARQGLLPAARLKAALGQP